MPASRYSSERRDPLTDHQTPDKEETMMENLSRSLRALSLLALLGAMSAGCVSKTKYDLLSTSLNDAQAEKERIAADLVACREAGAAVKSELENCRAHLENQADEMTRLQAESATLQSNLEETRQAVEAMRQRARQQEERLKTYRALLARFQRLIESGKLEVEVRRGRMVVKLGEGILFDSGSAELKPSGKAVLDEVTHVLAEIPNRNFQIEGHTDDVPLRPGGAYANNWELSAARAISVVLYMIEQGMDPHRLSAAGYGEYTPIVPNDTDELRALNRRIEIVLMPNLDELPSLDDLEAAQ